MKLNFKHKLLYHCVLLAVNVLQCFSQPHKREDTFIDRNSSGVVFSAHIEPDISDTEEVETMLEVVSERFSHVILDTGIIEIPIAAAQVNRRLKNSQFPPPPLNTKLTINFNEDSEQSSVLSIANETLHLAFIANSIYPNTVTTLLLNVNDIENEKSENMSMELLSYIRNHTLGKELQLQLGIWLVLADCGFQTSVPEHTLRVLEKTDLVIFHHGPQTNEVAAGAQKNVQNLIKQFSICKKKIRRSLQNEVKILWSTTSSSSGEKGYSIEYFIEYWKLLTEWATKNQQFIFFIEAFDTQIDDDDSPSEAHRGWWRLAEKDVVTIEKSSFVEKLLDFYVPQQDVTTQATTIGTSSSLARNQPTRGLPCLFGILCFYNFISHYN